MSDTTTTDAAAEASPLGLFADPHSTRADTLAAQDAELWKQEARRRLARMILTGATFDAHHLTEAGLSDPPRPRLMSGLFTSASSAGYLEKVGYHPSRRSTSGSVVATWKGTAAGRAYAQHLLAQGPTA